MKLNGKDYSSDVILQSNKKQVNISNYRTNTYDFWLSGQYGKCNSTIDASDMVVPGLYISCRR